MSQEKKLVTGWKLVINWEKRVFSYLRIFDTESSDSGRRIVSCGIPGRVAPLRVNTAGERPLTLCAAKWKRVMSPVLMFSLFSAEWINDWGFVGKTNVFVPIESWSQQTQKAEWFSKPPDDSSSVQSISLCPFDRNLMYLLSNSNVWFMLSFMEIKWPQISFYLAVPNVLLKLLRMQIGRNASSWGSGH